MNNEETSSFFVDYIMNEIDSLVSEVVKHPENQDAQLVESTSDL